MIAVGFEDALRLVADPLHAGRVTRLAQVSRPEGKFRLKVDAFLVGRGEARLRRAIRMEPHVVESPFFEDFENPAPSLDIHRRITGERKRGPLVRAAQKGRDVIEQNGRTRGGDFAETAHRFRSVVFPGGILQSKAQTAKMGSGVAPQRELFALERNRRSAAVLVPPHGDGDFFLEVRSAQVATEKTFTAFSRDVAETDFRAGLGGIRIDAHTLDPDWRGGAKFDFAHHAVPDRLRVFDVSVRASDVEELPVVHSHHEFVAPRRGQRAQIENMRRAQRVLCPRAASIQPDLALPKHALHFQCDAFSLPVRRDFDGAPIPYRADEGVFAMKTG